MTEQIRHIASRVALTLKCLLVASCAALLCSAGALAAESPPAGNTVVTRPECSLPAPGHASCMALQFVSRARFAGKASPLAGKVSPLTRGPVAPALSPAAGGDGFTPAALHTAYALPTSALTEQTIALVDAYNDPTAEKDLNYFSKEFGLKECTSESGCFKQINESGSGEASTLPFPKTTAELETWERSGVSEKEAEAYEAIGWGVEISLDIETAHSICESCKIVLVEANSTSYTDLEAAESAAEKAGATEVSNSWGGAERGANEAAGGPFEDPGTVITVSAGDNGYLNWDSTRSSERGYANFPASSPHVVSVGGTHLDTNATTGAWEHESVWNGDGAGGGGCSGVFAAPSWQKSLSDWSSVGCGTYRSVADVSADADPATGVAVRDTDGEGCEEEGYVNPNPNWCPIGGTSLSSPMIAATFALAGGSHNVRYPAKTLYENEAKLPLALHDIASGSNGECRKGYNSYGESNCTPAEAATQCAEKATCLAGTGYDGPTGVGTPDGIEAFEPSQQAIHEAEEEAKEEQKEGPKAKEEEATGKKEREQSSGGSSGSGGTTVTTTPVTTPVTTPTTSPSPSVQLGGFGLTVSALIALNQGRPKMSRMGFSFTSNVPVAVTVTLTKHLRVHAHLLWKTVGRPLKGTAVIGRNAWHMVGGLLKRGSYRLTIVGAGAPAKTISFLIG